MTLQLGLMRWVTSLVGVQMLCGIVWVLGPLLPALEQWPARLAVVMALILLWVALNLLLDLRRARRDVALSQGVTGAAADEAGAVGARLAAAMTLMRKAKGRRFNLYEQPWYAIIGPPGAGKTTALLNAGLVFPLAAELGPGAVAGVGGTRLCDWWFTQDAVLIDTAGRYTTQDSNRAVDSAGWTAFLALLRRTRPRQPLNGVIVAIALADLAGPGAALAAHAAAIRSRINEIEAAFGMPMPVYAIVTKTDQLAGFSEFFADLDRPAREQIWGCTFALAPSSSISDQVAEGLRPLLDGIDRRVFTRLDAEDNLERRRLIAGFPAQLASILPPLQRFAVAAFGPQGPENNNVTGKPPLLRGVYLTSATQEGTPIDRLVGTLSRTFGLDQRRAPVLRPEAGRSFFLAALLRDVIFREAPLVAFRPGAAARRRALRIAGYAACVLAALGGAGFALAQRQSQLAAIDHASHDLAAQQAMAATLPLDPVAEADVAQLVPWLNAARQAAMAPDTDPPGLPGFNQHANLVAAARLAYRQALENALFPRLVWRTETRMRGLSGQPDALYDATRVYLMLGGAGPLDRALVQDWFARDWAAALPGQPLETLRADLDRHLAALLDASLPQLPLDGPLVASARAAIGQVPLAQRAYSRLKPAAAAAAAGLAPWRPSDALTPAGVNVFTRLSGRGLEEGIPATYTLDGFRKAVLPALAAAAHQALAEGWVLGAAAEPDERRLQGLQAEVAALYAADYADAWDAMLADLVPTPLRSLTGAAQDLFILSSAHSPMREILAAAAAQLAPASAAPPELAAPMATVDRRFQPLRSVFGTGGAAPIDQALRPLYDLQQQLAKQAASATKLAPPAAAEDPAAALRAEAARQPQPLSRWLNSLAIAGAALREGGPRGAMIAAWNAPGGPAALCAATVANRYPFAPAAQADAPLDDVTRLFAPGGAIDAFFNAQLKPYVDTTARPWKVQPADGVNAPLTPADVQQFQRAATIRDLLFQGGARQPLVRFDLIPGPLDPGLVEATFALGPTTLTATRNKPSRPVALVWPGQPAMTAARLVIARADEAATADPAATIERQGPWALFRMLAAGRATPAADHITIAFTARDRTARLDLRATPNPFGAPVFTEFRCPVVQ